MLFRGSKHGFVRIGSAEEVVMSIAVQPIADDVSSSAFTFTIIVTIIISVFVPLLFQFLYQRAGTKTEKVGLSD